MDNNRIYESGEDYLEAILVIGKDKTYVRAIDIVHHLNYSKPSVSRALAKLKDQGYIDINNNVITLTESGNKIANMIYERHEFFSKFLVKIGVNASQAAIDACKMEHAISEETFHALKVKLNSIMDEKNS